MIFRHVRCGQEQKALQLFQQMQQGVRPNAVTFVGVLKACASMVALQEGRCVFLRKSFKVDGIFFCREAGSFIFYGVVS
jgi:pentatricopeptide repeat protein